MAGNGCTADILKNHLLPNVICSGVVQSRAKSINDLKKYLLIQRDEADLLVEGLPF